MKKNYDNPFEALFDKKEADYLTQIADKDIEIRKLNDEVKEYRQMLMSISTFCDKPEDLVSVKSIKELLAKRNKGE